MRIGKIVFSVIACSAITFGAEILTLSRAYELALKNEPKLNSLALKTEAAQEYIEQSKSRLLPQLQGSLSWGYYGYNADYLRSPVKENYSSYSLTASQPVYHPEFWSGIDEAKARKSATKYQFNAEAQKLGLDVAKAYFDLMRTKQNILLLNSKKEYYQSKYKQLSEMLKLGLSNRIDMLESKIHLDKATAEWLREQKLLQVATLRLQHFINIEVGDLPSFDLVSADINRLFQERAIWEEKLRMNPSLMSAVATEDMTRQQIAIQKYGHYPKVDASISRKETYTQDTVSHKYDNQAIVQVSIPLYQGGYTESKIRESLLMAQSAQKDLEYTKLQTTLRFEELWADHELNIQSLIVLRDSEKSAELYLDSVEKGNSAGLKSLVDVLEAKSKLYEVKRDAVDAQYSLVGNYLGLLDVSGELNSENIAILETLAIHIDSNK